MMLMMAGCRHRGQSDWRDTPPRRRYHRDELGLEIAMTDPERKTNRRAGGVVTFVRPRAAPVERDGRLTADVGAVGPSLRATARDIVRLGLTVPRARTAAFDGNGAACATIAASLKRVCRDSGVGQSGSTRGTVRARTEEVVEHAREIGIRELGQECDVGVVELLLRSGDGLPASREKQRTGSEQTSRMLGHGHLYGEDTLESKYVGSASPRSPRIASGPSSTQDYVSISTCR